MTRYFAWRSLRHILVRPVLWALDRVACALVIGPAMMAWSLLRLVPAVFKVAFALVFVPLQVSLMLLLPLIVVSLAAAAFGVGMWVAWAVMACWSIFAIYLVARLLLAACYSQLYRVPAAFGGKGALSAVDYAGVVALVGAAAILDSTAWSAADWSSDSLGDSFSDFGMVNPASGLPMIGGGIGGVDMGGNVFGSNSFGTDSFGGFDSFNNNNDFS